jgi:hypothetical protein
VLAQPEEPAYGIAQRIPPFVVQLDARPCGIALAQAGANMDEVGRQNSAGAPGVGERLPQRFFT